VLVALIVALFAQVLRADPAPARPGPAGNAPAAAAAPKPADWSMFAGKDDGLAHAPVPSPAPQPTAPAQGLAQTPKSAAPPAPVPPSEFTKTDIHRGAKETGNSAAEPAASSGSNYSDAPRVVLALAVVIALILLLRWGGRRIFGLPGAGRASHAVQVLSRSALTPRQQVVLLKVGRRVLVVADNGSQMNSLCQITDPDEVATLVGQLRTEKASAAGTAAGAFGGLFGRSRKIFGEPGEDDPPPERQRPNAAAAARMPTGERPPAARGPARDAKSQAITDPEDIGFDEAEAEAAVAVARQELMGLKEKLRMVSERFGTPEEGQKKKPPRRAGDRGPAMDGLFKDEGAATMESLFKEEGAT
jgi:flagellar biogenesis protein FliO